MLNKANHQQQTADRSHRPAYHFSVPIGWLNDPNGLSVFGGRIHLFYQYYPYDIYWSYMHWGHAVSDDLIHWKDLPVAMAPDEPYDAAGCFSGSAVELDGQHALIYTGVSGVLGEDGLPHGPQQQCLALGDGVTYSKSTRNPVITTEQLPAGFLAQDFRDPKVWKTEDGYRMVVAAAQPDGNGCVLVYDSPDLIAWTLRGPILVNDGSYGTMWECPDVFSLDGEDVALISIIAMQPGHETVHPDNPVLAFVGRADWMKPAFDIYAIQQLDEGTDFYAPQTLEMPDGRRVLIAWMQSGHNRIAPHGQNWQGMMTFPRELTLSDGHLVQVPAREIEQAWSDSVSLKGMEITGDTVLPQIHGRSLDLTLDFHALQGWFRIGFACGDDCGIFLTWDPGSGVMTFDRSRAGGGSVSDVLPVQSFRVAGPLHSLRILLDRNSAEVFINGGRQTFTGIFYAPDDADGITFATEKQATLDIEKHTVAPAAV